MHVAQVTLVFWLCTFVALWVVLWATHGPPSRAPVHRGCRYGDPPVCLDAQGGIEEKRQPLWFGVMSCQCLLVVQTVNVISLHCSCTCFVSNNNS